jgi:hypothetical protein
VLVWVRVGLLRLEVELVRVLVWVRVGLLRLEVELVRVPVPVRLVELLPRLLVVE